MKFKNDQDRQVVIRSLLLVTHGDEKLANEAVDQAEFYIDAIKYILEKLDKKTWKTPDDSSTKT